jgi:ankyrin repeat protein
MSGRDGNSSSSQSVGLLLKERIANANDNGILPFHVACYSGTVATVKYLYQLNPESINVAAKGGHHPIHFAIIGLKNRSNPKDGIEVLRFLLSCNPDALSTTGRTPLHIACNICNIKHVTLNTIQLLTDAFPDSLRHEAGEGGMPLHYLCGNKDLDDEVGLKILKLLLESYPGAVRHTTTDGALPIHFAAAFQSPEFCSILIKAYPESERVANDLGYLPFHRACRLNTVATAKYFYQLYPESINVAGKGGNRPIHLAIMGLKLRSNPKDGIEVAKFLLDCNPDALGSTGETPLHYICRNKNITLVMVQLLIDAFPESLRHEDNNGMIPLHYLCSNVNLDEEVRMDILKLLVERCPESVRHVTRNGNLPLHIAATHQSPEFCRILIEAYPGSERMTNNFGQLPFHRACLSNTVATAKYLYQLYPESINVADNKGYYPIHNAISGLKRREHKHESSIEMVQFLLDCNPDVALQKLRDKLPLYFVCSGATNENTQRLNVYLKVMQILYDAHPEAIESNDVTLNVGSFCQEVQTFIRTQLTYARKAKMHNLMNTPDENGQLPLHKAFHDNATITLGSIKLLVKGNPSAKRCADNRGMMPLHVACQHHESRSTVEYLFDIDPAALRAKDFEDNTALHHACRGANHAIIALLLGKYGSMYVAKRNAHNQLPIDLLLQNKNEVSDEDSVKFTESIYRLIRANPETLMHCDLEQAAELQGCLSRNRKKRKVEEL